MNWVLLLALAVLAATLSPCDGTETRWLEEFNTTGVENETQPTLSPSVSPSISTSPSLSPSVSPSLSPTVSPSLSPTVSPSKTPTHSPSKGPSVSPTHSASKQPTVAPSFSPEAHSTQAPSAGETTSSPSIAPSYSPTLRAASTTTKAPTTSDSVTSSQPTPDFILTPVEGKNDESDAGLSNVAMWGIIGGGSGVVLIAGIALILKVKSNRDRRTSSDVATRMAEAIKEDEEYQSEVESGRVQPRSSLPDISDIVTGRVI